MAISAKPGVIVICGPTGTGKTAAALDLALSLGGEIISADSMQVYKNMDIGTAKATAWEQARVRHHLIDVVRPDQPFDAGRFARLGAPVITRLWQAGKISFVVGGTGLYIKALVQGLAPARPGDPDLRQRLQDEAARLGSPHLHQRLNRCDPQGAAQLHPNDAQRIVRALEVYELTGQRLSALKARHGFGDTPYRVLKIGLTLPRAALFERIDHRVEHMVAAGLVGEVLGLLDRGYDAGLKSMQSIGYRHMTDFVQGRLAWAEALRTMQRDTRRYAKRQQTWFGGDPAILWTAPRDLDQMQRHISSFLE